MTSITPIETRYKGYRFRSRLEARWAVFFEAVGRKWQYEPEGFALGTEGAYLPDFWLPETREWIEIKPTDPSGEEQAKASALQRLMLVSGHQVLILCGSPWRDTSGPPEHIVWLARGNECVPDSDVQFLQCFGCNRVILTEMLWGTYYYCEACDMRIRPAPDRVGDHGWYWHEGNWYRDRDDLLSVHGITATDPRLTNRLMTAYSVARSARFEHGESG